MMNLSGGADCFRIGDDRDGFRVGRLVGLIVVTIFNVGYEVTSVIGQKGHKEGIKIDASLMIGETVRIIQDLGEGKTEKIPVDDTVGTELGSNVGSLVGIAEGSDVNVPAAVGISDGRSVGTDDGIDVGIAVGDTVGTELGSNVGSLVGIAEGSDVDVPAAVGISDGRSVGTDDVIGVC